jgi:uncharacterized protein (DUF1499 family)
MCKFVGYISTAFLAILLVAPESFAYQGQHQHYKPPGGSSTRRGFLAAVAVAVTVTAPITNAKAFPNALPEAAKYSDRPKRPGPQPKDLGVGARGRNDEDEPIVGLKGCGAAPNCFSTTGDEEIDRFTLIPALVPPASERQPMSAIKEVVLGYTPGQSNVDGGGFELVQASDDYIYAQFESLKNHYIDDVEFALLNRAKNQVLVRSSSRLVSA